LGVPRPQNPKPLGSEGPIYLGAYSNPIDFALQKIEFEEEGKAMLFYHQPNASPISWTEKFVNW
jgi:hypothetical protein